MTADARLAVRGTLVALMAAALFAGVAGLWAPLAFQQVTPLKVGVTVAGPALALALALAQRPLRLAVAVLVLAVPVAPNVVYVAGIRLPPVLLLGTLAVATAVVAGAPARRLSPTGWCAAAAVLLGLAGVLRGEGPITVLLLLSAYLVVGWLCSLVASEDGGAVWIIGAIVGTVALQGAIAIWQYRSGQRIDLYGAAGTTGFGQRYHYTFATANRPVGTFLDPNSLGNALALGLPLAVGLMSHLKRRSGTLSVALCAAAITGGLALSLSRMSWIAAAVGMFVAVAMLPGMRPLRVVAIGLAALAVIVPAAIAIGGEPVRERAQSLLHPSTLTKANKAEDRVRIALWSAALAEAREHPIGGTGIGRLAEGLERRVAQATRFDHAHSTYMQVLAEAGIVGLAGLGLLLGAAVRDGLRARGTDPALAAGILGAVAAVAVTWSTDYTVRYPGVALLIVAVLGTIAGRAPRRVTR